MVIKDYYDSKMELIRVLEASVISILEEISPVSLYLLLTTSQNYKKLDITNDMVQQTLCVYKKYYPELPTY